MVPLKIDNLLVAGRCVSAEFNANAAVRVIATCMSTGQAVGTAAALCLQSGLTPRELDGKEVRNALIKQGVPLDKEPDQHWQNIRETEGEFVLLSGDFIGIKTSQGIKVHL